MLHAIRSFVFLKFHMLSKRQIEKIVNEISIKANVQGVLLAGSYVYGCPTEESDLDVRIITSDGSNRDDRNWRKYGKTIEAFYNSPTQVRKYYSEAIKEGDETIVNIWRKGRVVYDPNGIVSVLQQEAIDLWERGPETGEWKTRPEYKKKMEERKRGLHRKA